MTRTRTVTGYPEPPVFDAYRTRLGQLAVWCEHEATWHRHGRCRKHPDCRRAHRTGPTVPCTCPTGSGDGHRIEHCICVRSPLHAAGYVLREVGPLTAAVKAAHRSPSRRHGCPGAECVAARAEAAARRRRAGLRAVRY